MSTLYEFFSGNFLSMYFFSCIGAIVLWMKLTARARHANSLGDIVDTMFPGSSKLAAIVKFLIFVFFGGFIAVIIVAPVTIAHAISAGVAWSRLAAKD